MQADVIFSVLILIISVILHEVAHGYMANYLGDPTARLQGRLTLNPLKHIDPMGSIFLPLLLKLSGSPMLIGYAKPVPYNPHNLSGKYDEAWVAAAGPLTNIALALVFGFAIRFGGATLPAAAISACAIIALTNIVLAIFNLVPIPPLDGSKVLSGLLPGAAGHIYDRFRARFERLGVLSGTILLMLLFYFFLVPVFDHVVYGLFSLLTGVSI